MLHCHINIAPQQFDPHIGAPASGGLTKRSVNVSNFARKPCDPGACAPQPRPAEPGPGRIRKRRGKPINLGLQGGGGGYSGNPAVIPFLRTTATEDVLIVQINPRERRKVPTSTREIMSRVNEINFNASLLSELRGVAFVNRLIDEGRLPRGTREGEFRRLKLHRIVMEDLGNTFGARSTLKTDYEYFETLRKLGQRATRRFLDKHFNDIGRRSTIDIADKIEAELAET